MWLYSRESYCTTLWAWAGFTRSDPVDLDASKPFDGDGLSKYGVRCESRTLHLYADSATNAPEQEKIIIIIIISEARSYRPSSPLLSHSSFVIISLTTRWHCLCNSFMSYLGCRPQEYTKWQGRQRIAHRHHSFTNDFPSLTLQVNIEEKYSANQGVVKYLLYDSLVST